MLSLIIKKPQLVVKIRPEDEGFFSIQFKDISGKINMEQKEPPIAQLVSTAEPALTMSLEFAFLKSQEMWKDFPDHELDEEFDKLIRQIKKRKLSAQLASLEYDIRSAEKEKNKERLAVLVAEFSKISKQL